MIITRGASVGNASISWNSIKSRLECCTQCVRNFHGQCSAILPVWRRTGALLYGFMVDLLDISIHPKVVADLLWELSLFVSWDQRERQATINLCLDKEKPQLIVIHLLGLGYMHQSLRKWEKIQLQTLSRAADAHCAFVTVSKLES